MSFDPSLSNSLADLAAKIRVEHDGAATAAKRGLEHAIAAGELLVEAKSKLQHGQWLPWLDEHCGMSDRTARAYMRLARNKDRLGEIGSVADLSLRSALYVLSAHLPSDDDENTEWAGVMPIYERARSAVRTAADGIGLGSIENDLELVKAATNAVAEARNVDELAALADSDTRLRGYLRQAEGEFVACATEIRLRMEHRLGQMITAAKPAISPPAMSHDG